MFERVILRRSLDGPPITAGEIAEALLFYQSVHIVLDHASLFGLVKSIGMRNILKLLSLPDVKATYLEESLGTLTDRTDMGDEYSFVSHMLVGDQTAGQFESRKKRLSFMIERFGYKRKEAKRLGERFRQCVTYKNLGNDYYVKGGVIAAAQIDLFDEEYVTAASRVIVQRLAGGRAMPADFFVHVNPVGSKFRIATNLDFNMVSAVQNAKNPNAGQYTPAHLATELLNASVGLVFAGHYGGDFYTSEAESEIIQLRQYHLLRRFNLDRLQITHFQDVSLSGSPSIVEVINLGHRSFEEFLELLSSARKFKGWLKGKSPDESLIAGYLEDVTSVGWLGSIPGKLLRYVIGAGAGAIEPASGLAISAGDSFFLERLLSGWRPNQFVTNKIKPFIDYESANE
jgi:hypothetical protein